MNILLIAEVFHPDTIGGAGRVAAELASNLAALGHRVRVVSRATPRAPVLQESMNGFEIFRFPVNPKNPFSVMKAVKIGFDEALSRALDEFTPSVIDLHQPLTAYTALNHDAVMQVPSVYTFHSSWADEMRVRGGSHFFFAPLARTIEKSVVRSARRIAVLSDFSRRLVREMAKDARIEIIPGGVDLDRFPMKSSAARTPKPVLFTVRNLVRRMGIENLIEAASILRKKGIEFELRIGGTGPLEEELRREAEPLGDSCVFLGHIPEEDLPRRFREADLFVLPTTAIEGFGLVILESFASGTPVVGTPVGAIPELLRMEGDGAIADDASPEAIARAVEAFLTRADPMRPDALRGIAEKYSWRLRAERMVDLYRKIV